MVTSFLQSEATIKNISFNLPNSCPTGKEAQRTRWICNNFVWNFQGSVIGWVHNHRIHHKYSDTDADPHNARRGFFYSHIGWLLVHYHPKFLEKRKVIDMSDLKSDPILAFQKKYFLILMPLIAFVIPAVVPFYFWGESLNVAYHTNVFRYIICIHSAFMINSWAHIYGNKPYDR